MQKRSAEIFSALLFIGVMQNVLYFDKAHGFLMLGDGLPLPLYRKLWPQVQNPMSRGDEGPPIFSSRRYDKGAVLLECSAEGNE